MWWEVDAVEQAVRKHLEAWEVDAVRPLPCPPNSNARSLGVFVLQVITFDDYGVSGHANHRALSSALRCVLSVFAETLSLTSERLSRSALARSDPSFPRVFAVQSTSVLAKYTSLLLLPFTLLQRVWPSSSRSRDALFVNSLAQYRATRRSFDAHQSQAVWFRSLFVSFSRYLWWVELRRVV